MSVHGCPKLLNTTSIFQHGVMKVGDCGFEGILESTAVTKFIICDFKIIEKFQTFVECG